MRRYLIAPFLMAMFSLTAAPTNAQQSFFFGGRTVLDQNPSVLINGVEVHVAGTNLTTESFTSGLFTFFLPGGTHSLEFSGNCTVPSSAVIEVPGGAPFPRFPLATPFDPESGYRCTAAQSPRDNFDPAALPKRANVSPTRGTAISFPFDFQFGNTKYRRLYVTAQGWLSFKPITSLPCAAISSANVPAASLFPFAGCAQAKEVKYVIPTGNNRLVMQWRLVVPGTTETTDVRVTLIAPAEIQIEYGQIGGTGDGSAAFIGMRDPTGDVFSIGDHEAVVVPFSALRLLPPS